MNIVVNWRIVHHKATKDGKAVDAKTVIFEQISEGVHMSTQQIDHELWEAYKARNLQGRTFVQTPDLHHDPNEKKGYPFKPKRGKK